MGTNSRIRPVGGVTATSTDRAEQCPRHIVERRAGTTDKIEQVIALIAGCIVELRDAGFRETAEMLSIARLDLLVRLNGVSDTELDALIEAASIHTPL